METAAPLIPKKLSLAAERSGLGPQGLPVLGAVPRPKEQSHFT
jgi:hypothetical protein